MEIRADNIDIVLGRFPSGSSVSAWGKIPPRREARLDLEGIGAGVGGGGSSRSRFTPERRDKREGGAG